MPANILITLVLAALTALAPFAIDTYLPAFAAMELDLGTSTHHIQQSLTFYLLPYALMTLWHGAISDAIGRIATIRIGLFVFLLASIGCALAPNVETLWFFRALQGLSGGAGNVVARAMVRDLYAGAQAQRVMASIQMLFGIAPAVAPLVGGFFLGFHWQAIFIFLALYAGFALWAAVTFLPETMPKEKRLPLSMARVLAAYQQVFRDREFGCIVIASGANFSGFFIYVLASPVFLIKHLGLSPQQFGWMFIPTVCCMIAGSYLARRAAGRWPAKRVIRIAYLWMAAVALLNVAICWYLPPAVWYNIAPVALFNIGMAFAMPVLSLAALDRHPKIRGTAASGQAFIQMLLSTVSAGLVIPLLWDKPIGLAFGMCAYLLLSWLVLRPTQLWQLDRAIAP